MSTKNIQNETIKTNFIRVQQPHLFTVKSNLHCSPQQSAHQALSAAYVLRLVVLNNAVISQPGYTLACMLCYAVLALHIETNTSRVMRTCALGGPPAPPRPDLAACTQLSLASFTYNSAVTSLQRSSAELCGGICS